MSYRLALIAALLACGCGDRAENAPPPPPAVTTAIQDSSVAQPGAPQALLRAIAPSTQLDYDRVEFAFDGDVVPGYHVEYATRPVRCGSGDPVSVQGAGQILVRFEPARAHDDQGRPTLPAREGHLGLPALTEWKLICDFEGQVEILLGATARTPYRMNEQAAPGRLALDVQRAP